MGESKSVRSAVPRPTSPKILRRLQEAPKIKLGRTDRNTVFVFEKSDDMRRWGPNRYPIAIAPRISATSSGNKAVLENVLVLNTMSTSLDVSLIIPNTTRHTYLADYIEDHLVNFGAMDDCISPDCKKCRRSAQCLTGGICHSVVGFGRFHKVKATGHSVFGPGDRFNQWTFAMNNHMAMRSMPREGPVIHCFDIWLHRVAEDTYELEFTRSE